MSKLKTFLIAASCIGWMSCITDDAKQPGPMAPGPAALVADPASLTTMQWTDSVINSGTVLEGTKLEVVFHFKNTGEKPIIIESAQQSCGCTIAEKPEKPVMPGQEGQIKAIFNSQGRTGTNHKTITVHANTSPSGNHLVEFNVNVIGKTEGPKAADTKPTTQF